MDALPVNPTPQPKTAKPPGKPKLKIILSSLAVLLVIVGAVFYFKLLRQSGKLTPPPSKPPEVKNITAKPLVPLKGYNKAAQIGPFVCPATPESCKDKVNFKDNIFSAKLPLGTKAMAAFDGTLEVLNSTSFLQENNKKDEYTTLVLTNLEKGLIAHYSFKGTSIKEITVKEGQIIATISNEPLLMYGDNTFAFQIIKLDGKSQSVMDLKPVSFK